MHKKDNQSEGSARPQRQPRKESRRNLIDADEDKCRRQKIYARILQRWVNRGSSGKDFPLERLGRLLGLSMPLLPESPKSRTPVDIQQLNRGCEAFLNFLANVRVVARRCEAGI